LSRLFLNKMCIMVRSASRLSALWLLLLLLRGKSFIFLLLLHCLRIVSWLLRGILLLLLDICLLLWICSLLLWIHHLDGLLSRFLLLLLLLLMQEYLFLKLNIKILCICLKKRMILRRTFSCCSACCYGFFKMKTVICIEV